MRLRAWGALWLALRALAAVTDSYDFSGVKLVLTGLSTAVGNKVKAAILSDSAFLSQLAAEVRPYLISELNLYLRANPPVPGQPQKF